MNEFENEREEIAWLIGGLAGFGPTIWALLSNQKTPEVVSDEVAVNYENAIERLGVLVLGARGHSLHCRCKTSEVLGTTEVEANSNEERKPSGGGGLKAQPRSRYTTSTVEL